jgi:hypothetical protein
MSFFYIFSAGLGVPLLIADASGLILDVARMVQGSSYSPISIRSQIISETLFA